jgi:hypothetical protein
MSIKWTILLVICYLFCVCVCRLKAQQSLCCIFFGSNIFGARATPDGMSLTVLYLVPGTLVFYLSWYVSDCTISSTPVHWCFIYHGMSLTVLYLVPGTLVFYLSWYVSDCTISSTRYIGVLFIMEYSQRHTMINKTPMYRVLDIVQSETYHDK